MTAIILYFVIINIAGFSIMGYDKGQAARRRRRVPEKRLFGFAAAGGALGCMIAMRTFRHKTKHKSFVLGMPALLALNAVCFYIVIKGIGIF
ncbi:DUF1294 domain-containing protein [Paenibacillus sp. MBLB4367]|uniref:DUF1294 domain-containing protein n=1 Tax=Paenibacillus sp. MBLB4367 TaxID=3384767 RepID=UPI00390822D0